MPDWTDGTDRHTTGEHHGVGHIVPISLLAITGAGLLVLTAITVWVAGIDFGPANVWIALGIAAVKGSLVVLFFMHLFWDRPFNAVIFVTSLAFVALFISFAMTDTFEYAPDMDAGDAPLVQQKLDELEP